MPPYSLLRATRTGRLLLQRTLHSRLLTSKASRPTGHRHEEDEEKEPSIEEQFKELEKAFEFNSPENELISEQYLDDDGNQIFEFTAGTKIDENYDWGPFERAFGVDKIIKEIDQLDEFPLKDVTHSTVRLDDDEVKRLSWQPEKNKFNIPPKLERMLHNMGDNITVEGTYSHSKAKKEEIEALLARHHVGTVQCNDMGFGDTDTTAQTDANAGARTDAGVHGEIDDDVELAIQGGQRLGKNVQPKYASGKAPPGVTRKLGRASPRRRPHEKQSKAARARANSPPPPSASPVSADGGLLPEAALQLPESAKRSGNPWRKRALEAEMERIATPLLCDAGSAWRRAGGTLSRALLSPNGQTLIVHYSRERCEAAARGDEVQKDEARRRRQQQQQQQQDEAWNKECERAAGSVRAALAAGLHAKRVPRVVFEEVPEDPSIQTAAAADRYGSTEMDALFDRIAAERASVSTANASSCAAPGVHGVGEDSQPVAPR